MPVKIFDVDKKCKCAKKGIGPGDMLVSINGNEINDVLDFRFYSDEKKLELLFNTSKGKSRKVTIRNNDDCDSLGLHFETYLMDKHRRCKNSCIFCFIDQLPKGMRDSLYFKDDDSRLSFLFGNYITLTNLTENDVQRIIKMHISPVNVSVHTMNPELRVSMMRNPNAGKVLNYLKLFSDSGIRINAQLVLCPGINDGSELDFSLKELSSLDSICSIAAVPVGLTKYREGLYPLKSFDKESAAAVIDQIDSFNDSIKKSGRCHFAYASDEFYQIAEREMPEYSYYGEFPQLDNGVGLYRSLKNEFEDMLDEVSGDNIKRKLAFATGKAAYLLMKELADKFSEKFTETHIDVYCIENDFFGNSVTVAGLVTGQDLIKSLKKQGFLSPKLYLPSVMFKSSDELIFLDDVAINEVEIELHTKITVVNTDAQSLFDALTEY